MRYSRMRAGAALYCSCNTHACDTQPGMLMHARRCGSLGQLQMWRPGMQSCKWPWVFCTTLHAR
eukprot:1160795-Pelagomonas_calceolata.AAC.3